MKFEQRDGGAVIDTAMHRCTIHEPAQSDEGHRIEARNRKWDAVIYGIFVAVALIAVFDRYLKLLPGWQ